MRKITHILLSLLVLVVTGCGLNHKIVRICLPSEDSRVVVQGPSYAGYGINSGRIEMKGIGCYLSVPIIMDADERQIMMEYLQKIQEFPLQPKE